MTELIVATETLLLALLTLLVLGLLRSHAEILRRLEGLVEPATIPPPAAAPEQRPAPEIVGTTPSGEVRQYAFPPGGADTLLAFLSGGCSTCAGLLERLRDDEPVVPQARLIVVAKDPAEESPRRLAAISGRVHVVMSSRAWSDYDVPGSPYFAHVDGATGRVVGGGSAPTWERVASLLAEALEDASGRSADTPARVTEALRAAGVEAGDPSLHPSRR